MRIVFMGSAELACPCLDVVLGQPGHVVAGVVSQPARPCGRSLKPTPCPAHAHALEKGLPVLTPDRINTPDMIEALRAYHPDLIVVVAYGQILKPTILDLPPLGCVNVHASLLPKYRGAAPIQWAIANGEIKTGVTTMYMSPGMDEGDIIDQSEVDIFPGETAGLLHQRLSQAGAILLASTVERICAGTVRRRAQNPAEATYAVKLKKRDGRLEWRLPATVLCCRIRGFNPWPGCYMELGGDQPLKIKVLSAQVEAAPEGAVQVPGTLLSTKGEGPLIQAGEQAVRLLEVQPEGKRPMSGAAWARGYPLKAGCVLS